MNISLVPKDQCYFLSGRKAHFYRFCDTTFRDKWTGFWIMDKKFFDYFAFQIDDEWLSKDNIKNFEFHESEAKSIYETHLGKITEIVSMTDGEEIKLNLKNPKAKIIFEIGINMRNKSENWHNRSYEMKFKNSKEFLFLSSDKLYVRFNKNAKIIDTFYKNHMNNQRCMVVKFELESKNIKVRIFREKGAPIKRKYNYKNDNLNLAALSLNMLLKENKNLELYAGFPWFLEMWGRDLGWALPAMIDLKWYSESKRLLENILNVSKDNVPNFLNPPDYFSADATPLIIIALKYYVDATKDFEFIQKYKKKLETFLNWYRNHRDENGFFKNDMENFYDRNRGSTWMDTLHRPKAVEVQALWLKALKDMKKMNIDVDKDMKLIENSFEKYWNGNYYIDNFEDRNSITPNMLVPVILGVSKHPKDVLKIVEEKLSTPYGILTLPKDDPKFSFNKYHQGQIWSLTTGWMAIAEFMYGTKGKYYLDILCKSQKKCLPGVGETFNDMGNILGCKIQAWGSAMIIRAMKEFENKI